jgi:hypothetical protein
VMDVMDAMDEAAAKPGRTSAGAGCGIEHTRARTRTRSQMDPSPLVKWIRHRWSNGSVTAGQMDPSPLVGICRSSARPARGQP